MLQSCRRIARAAPGKPDYAVGPRGSYRAAKNRVGRCRRPLLSASRSLYGVGSERIILLPGSVFPCDGAKLYRSTHLKVKLKALDFQFNLSSPATFVSVSKVHGACMAHTWLRGGIASPPAGETRSSGLIGSPRWREARRVGLLLRRARRAEAVAVSGYAQLELIFAGWNAEAIDDCQPESRRRIKDPNSLGGVRGGPTKIQATIWAKQDQVEVVGRIVPPVSLPA